MAKRTGAPSLGAKRGDLGDILDAGDLISLSFSPRAGREQGARRPGLVLSARLDNAKVGLCLICPVTNRAKGYAFEVALPEGLPVQGVVLADHAKSANWQVRGSEFIATAPATVLEDVRAKLKPLLGI